MGQDKSLLPFGGYSTLTQYQYTRLKPLFDRVYISAKTADKFPFCTDVILDPDGADYAPTAGFVSTFRTLGDERVVVLSVDTPFVGEEIFHALLDADVSDADAIIARTHHGTHPLCGIYHRSLLHPFERMAGEGDHRLGKLLSLSRTRYVDFKDEEPFANLNRPHEYEAAVLRMSGSTL